MKKIIAGILIIMGSFVGCSLEAEAMTGLGTIENPYILYDCTDLQNIKQNVSGHYKLGGDIDCSDSANWNEGNGFEPIVGFAGTLDGVKYNVLYLSINRPTSSNVGFMGSIMNTATIKNMNLQFATITGNTYVGGIAGTNSGIITNVLVSGSVTGTGPAASHVGGIVGANIHQDGDILYSGSSAHVSNTNGTNTGGIVGTISFLSHVEHSSFNGILDGGTSSGGIIGYNNDGVIYRSYSTGTVRGTSCVGGIIGNNNSQTVIPFVENIYARGSVTASVSSAGGIVGCGKGKIEVAYSAATVSAQDGIAHAIVPVGYPTTIVSSYYDAEIGPSISGGGTALTTAQMKTQASYDAKWLSIFWRALKSDVNDGYPHLVTFAGPDFTPPKGTLSITATNWTKNNISIRAVGEDTQSGMNSIRTPSIKTVLSDTTYSAPQNGTYTFHFEDKTGNISTEQITISLIDKIMPEATMTLDNENWTKNPVTIHISSSDADSGVWRIYKPGLPVVLGNTTTHVVNTNGSYLFRVEDNATNRLERTLVITNIDKDNPTVILSPNTTDWSNAVTIQAIGSDPTSGVKQIKMPNGTYIPGSVSSFVATSNGLYTFEVEDLAGNVTTQSININNIDNEYPIVSFDPLTRDWESTPVSVNVSVSDTGNSLFKQHRFSWTKSTDTPLEGWSSWNTSATGIYEQPLQGVWYLHIEAADNAGNIGYHRGGPYRIDTSGPELSVDFTEISTTSTYGEKGMKDLRFNGSVTEDNPSSSVEVGYYIERASGGAKVVADRILLEADNDVQDMYFNGQHTVTSALSDGDYRLVVYAKNDLALINSESVPFRVAIPPQSTKPNVNITVHPKPSGNWQNYFQDIFVTDNGDFEFLATALKQYEVTNNAVAPTTFTKTLPLDQKIALTQVGINYVHVKYTLEDDSVIVSTTGPYMIDTAPIGAYEAWIENTSTNTPITDWTKSDTKLIITDPNSPSISGYIKQYRIENYHIDWQTYAPNTEIQVEGKNRVFVRVINKANTSSEQSMTLSLLDKTAPSISNLLLKEESDQSYSVTVNTQNELSGIADVRLNTSTKLVGSDSVYSLNNIAEKPISVVLSDHAGNTSEAIPFEAMPTVTFNSPYTKETEVYRSDVIANISGSGNLSGRVGGIVYNCASNPCVQTISKNTTFIATSTNGLKVSSKIILIDNIDKSPLRLVLNAHRDPLNAKSIAFKWNYNIPSGELSCKENGQTNQYPVRGKLFEWTGFNYTYTCTLVSTYGGEVLTSNEIVLYADSNSPRDGVGGVQVVPVNNLNVYIEESRIGTSFIINSRSNNFKQTDITIPDNLITR